MASKRIEIEEEDDVYGNLKPTVVDDACAADRMGSKGLVVLKVATTDPHQASAIFNDRRTSLIVKKKAKEIGVENAELDGSSFRPEPVDAKGNALKYDKKTKTTTATAAYIQRFPVLDSKPGG